MARNLVSLLTEQGHSFKFMVRDRDSKFTAAFETVFASEGTRVIKCPVQAPSANAFAERWFGTARRECTDHLLILSRCQLERVLHRYVADYNAERPHRGLELRNPNGPVATVQSHGAVPRTDVLGGVIHGYHRVAG